MNKISLLLSFSLLGMVAFSQSPCDAKMYDTIGFGDYDQVMTLQSVPLQVMPLKTFSLQVDSLKTVNVINVIWNKETTYCLAMGNASWSQTKVMVKVLYGETVVSENVLEVSEVKIIHFVANYTGMYQLQVTAVEPSNACTTLALGYINN